MLTCSLFVHFIKPKEQPTRRRRRPSVFREKSDVDLPFLAVKYQKGLKPITEIEASGKMGESSEFTKFLPHGENAIIDME